MYDLFLFMVGITPYLIGAIIVLALLQVLFVQTKQLFGKSPTKLFLTDEEWYEVEWAIRGEIKRTREALKNKSIPASVTERAGYSVMLLDSALHKINSQTILKKECSIE